MTEAAQDLLPNMPSWTFDPTIDEVEKVRLQDEIIARSPATSTSSA